MSGESIPDWCGPDCPFASFPEDEALDGACHTFIAIYCGKYHRLVHKSAPCIGLTEEDPDEDRS